MINGSLVHEKFIETLPKDMNEVWTKVEGIIRVEENRQQTAKNAAIAVAQNNTQRNFTKKPEGKQQRTGGGTELKKRPAESRENSYNCNPQKRFRPEEEGFDYTFIMPQEKIFAELKDQNIFRAPKPYNVPNHLKDRSQYCIFHEDYGHTLATCKNLYYQLRTMIRRGIT